jgi:hypothetical protein
MNNRHTVRELLIRDHESEENRSHPTDGMQIHHRQKNLQTLSRPVILPHYC